MSAPTMASGTPRVLVIVWDGMRPDLVTIEHCPRLWQFAQDGASFTRARSVYPPLTRPASGAVSTGCHPGAHGIHGNLIPNPTDARTPYLTGKRETLHALRPLHDGGVMRVKSLAESVRDNGGTFAVLSTGSAGQAMLLDPEDVGVMVNPAYVHPERVAARVGPPPAKPVPATAVNDWLADALLDVVLPEYAPDVTVMWLCEPDHSQHAAGLLSPQALSAIAGNDRRFGRILDAIAQDPRPTTVIVASDHGHTPVAGYVDVPEELRRGGFGRLLDEGLILPLEEELAASPALDAQDAQDVVDWLADQEWVDAVICWRVTPGKPDKVVDVADLWDGIGRDLPTAPLVSYTHPWTSPGSDPTRHSAWHSPPAAHKSHHGTLNPDDLASTLILGGAGIRSGVSDRPAGIIDIAPTVEQLRGHATRLDADGRVLWEALATLRPGPAAGEVTTRVVASLDSGTVHVETFDGGTYLHVAPAE
ncbi:alkaline phosphatase family protein [Saccharopolyspora pogona]|uniref:alkaline phosphatase family protein n=1 Tax=Saccharopolyspora pogona TaxID=333966 RepID=UPI0016838D5D|nr:alkaline phosphatase family protein [Saccharopolyspora pogona]